MSSSILKRILERAASRPVSPEDSEAVKTLKLRVAAAAAPTPEEMGRTIQPTQHAHQIPVRPRLPLAKSLGVTDQDLREVRDESPQELQRFIKLPLAEQGVLKTIANPAACAAAVTDPSEERLGPQTMRHIEHLERQMKMAEMRLKETRAQLEELDKNARDAACKAVWLEKRYREMNPADVGAWVEAEVFPALREVVRMASIEKGGAL